MNVEGINSKIAIEFQLKSETENNKIKPIKIKKKSKTMKVKLFLTQTKYLSKQLQKINESRNTTESTIIAENIKDN